MPLPIVAIFGPTAVGKTEVALALAERLRADGEDVALISADALQLYRGLEVLTGASDAGDIALTGILDVTDTCTAGEYAGRAHAEIDGALARGARPVVVGGTGLYLRAALARLDLRPPVPAEVRERWLAADRATLHPRLAERAPAAAARIDPGDTQRLVRAHELLDVGAEPPSGNQLWTTETRHPTLLAGLTMERGALDERIEARVAAMIAAGAMDEVRRADAAGASRGARQALGFEELLRGDIEAMKARTRRYARRQLTWMRKLPEIVTVDVTDGDAQRAAEELRSALRTAAVRSSAPTKRENGDTTDQ